MDLDDYRRRERDERLWAERADIEAARQTHRRLADSYRALIEVSDQLSAGLNQRPDVKSDDPE